MTWYLQPVATVRLVSVATTQAARFACALAPELLPQSGSDPDDTDEEAEVGTLVSAPFAFVITHMHAKFCDSGQIMSVTRCIHTATCRNSGHTIHHVIQVQAPEVHQLLQDSSVLESTLLSEFFDKYVDPLINSSTSGARSGGFGMATRCFLTLLAEAAEPRDASAYNSVEDRLAELWDLKRPEVHAVKAWYCAVFTAFVAVAGVVLESVAC